MRQSVNTCLTFVNYCIIRKFEKNYLSLLVFTKLQRISETPDRILLKQQIKMSQDHDTLNECQQQYVAETLKKDEA